VRPSRAAPRATAGGFQNVSWHPARGRIPSLTPPFPSADVDGFWACCDPDKENLCLYGNPDGTWEVQLPAEEVPPELPEPALGINFARDGMQVRSRGANVRVARERPRSPGIDPRHRARAPPRGSSRGVRRRGVGASGGRGVLFFPLRRCEPGF
jgi:hypothetical protein